ncbi:hypothetical protein [Methylorubrum zatmanii]
MRLLGILALAFSTLLVVSLVGVPIRAWSDPAPFIVHLKPVAAWGLALVLVVAAGCVLAHPRILAGLSGRALAVLGIAAALLWPAYALAQDAAGTTISLGDLFRDVRSTVETLIAVAVAGVLAFLASLLKKNLGLGVDEKMRNALQSALMNGVHAGLDYVQDAADRTSIDVKSEIVAKGIGYVRQYAPLAVKHFKLSEDDLAEMLRAKLAELQPAEAKAIAQVSGA